MPDLEVVLIEPVRVGTEADTRRQSHVSPPSGHSEAAVLEGSARRAPHPIPAVDLSVKAENEEAQISFTANGAADGWLAVTIQQFANCRSPSRFLLSRWVFPPLRRH